MSFACRRVQIVLLPALLLTSASAGWANSAQAGGNDSSSVLLITVDTLRADRLGCYGATRVQTPAMDALAREGVRFASAMAQVPITLPSHAVILSGTYPMTNGVRDFTSNGLPPNIELISQAMKRHGYTTAAFVSAFVLNRTWGFNRGFDLYDDHFGSRQFATTDPGNIERRGGKTIDRVLNWLQSPPAQAETKPFFVWLHLYDPHSPYDPPEPFRSEYRGRLYDGEVAYVDSQLARLFTFLKRRGLYNRMWVVLTSDHGESLGEHGEQEHGFFIYQSTLHVPMIFKPPHGIAPPAVLTSAVETIDIAPTLLDLLDIQDAIRLQFQGTSLAGPVLGKSPEVQQAVYAESYYAFHSFGWSPLRSLVAENLQFIQAPQRELYDLREDPNQTHNLAPRQHARATALDQRLTALETRFTAAHPVSTPSGQPLRDAAIQQLKSLGYLAYSAAAEPEDIHGLPDPKQKLPVYNGILHATDLARLGKLAESNAVLRRIQTTEAKLYLIPFLLGENAARAGQWAEAEGDFQGSLKLNPNFLQAIMGMGRSYLNSGDAAKARPWFELAAHNNPNEFLAYQALGLIARQQGRLEEAEGYFRKTLQQQPDYGPAALQLGVTLVELRRYPAAVEPLELATKTDATNAEAWNYLGTARANTGKPEAAIAAYQAALKLKPEYGAARLNLAFTYLKSGDQGNARKQFQILCQQRSPLCQQFRSTFQTP